MGIWESIENPLRAEGILSSRVRWPGKKTIQLAPCFSAPASTTRKNRVFCRTLGKWLETPKLCIFIFCVSSTAVGFRELWWFMTWSMLAEPKSLVFTFASWVDQGEEFRAHPQTIPVSQNGGVASSAVPLWLKVTRTSPRCCVFMCFRCFNPQWGLFGWNELKWWGERWHSTVLSVLTSILLENMGFR